MEKKQKVWIRGCNGRGEEVIQKLVALGGRTYSALTIALASDREHLFNIGHDGMIYHSVDFSESGKIIMEEYTEIKLKEKVKDESVNKIKDQQEFKVDDMVLRRASPNDKWEIFQYWYLLSRGGFCPLVEIIPYNEETKHLLNTTDDYTL